MKKMPHDQEVTGIFFMCVYINVNYKRVCTSVGIRFLKKLNVHCWFD